MTDYREFFRTGQISEAIRTYQDELRIEPRNVRASVALARALATIGDLEAAYRAIDYFIAVAPKHKKLIAVGRYLAFQFGDFEKSIEYSDILIEFFNDDDKPFLHKVYALLALGQEEAARLVAEDGAHQSESARVMGGEIFQRLDYIRQNIPALYDVWRLCPVRPPSGLPDHSPAKSAAELPTLIQYWSQGEIPADIESVCRRWDLVAEELGLPVERYDVERARNWISQNAPAFLPAFDGSFHPAMESDIFRIAHASRAPTFYVDVDSWPMPATTRIIRHCIENRGTLLYLRDYLPWLMNGLFVSYPDDPFVAELCAQVLAIDTNFEQQTVKTIHNSFGPGRYNNVVQKLLSSGNVTATTVADSGTSQVVVDGHIIYFARESSVASVKPPYPLDYKSGKDDWKKASSS